MPNSCLVSQYFSMSCAKLSFLCDEQCMISALRSCSHVSLAVASCISCMDVHIGRPTVMLILLTFMLRPQISLFSVSL